jgi:predicted 3-demethylubiquinone-9 3-methyltransferase (glyoxalase superfamily)
MQKIVPFLWFDGRTEEAVAFYVSIFSNSLVLSMRRMGAKAPGAETEPMTAEFQLEGQRFMAIDGGPMFQFSPAISFFVHCSTQEELDSLWEKLSEGGEILQCGWLKDKFGVTWQIIPTVLMELLYSPDPVKSGRAMQAMLQMKKLDIAALKRAYDGD